MNRLWAKFISLSLFQKAALCLVVFGVVMLVVFKFRSSNQPSYDRYTVGRGEISETIMISGNANATNNASIFSPSTGVVQEVFVKNGDSVVKGQELLKIQSTALETDRASALAAYKTAQSALQAAKQAKNTNQSQLESARKAILDAAAAVDQMNFKLSNTQVNTATGRLYQPNEVDAINSGYTSAKQSFAAYEKKFLDSDGAIAAAQSSVDAIKLAYDATVNGIIKSPLSGTVINLAVGVGDSVMAKDLNPILRIAVDQGVSIKVKLSEIDVNKVHEDQDAKVVFDAFPDKVFAAKVTRIDTVGVNINAVVTYLTYLTLINPSSQIRPEMTATVTIATNPQKNVLIIPNVALTKDKNNQIGVMLSQGSNSIFKPVSVGLKNSSESEIKSGLSEGDVVLIPKIK